MGFAIGFGVWSSIRISIGPAIREHSSFTWWVVNRLTFLVAATNLGVFMLFYLQERFDEFQGQSAAGPAATVVMFVGVFVLLVALPGGWLADRFGKKPLVAVSGFLAALGTFIALSVPVITGVYIGGCLMGAGARIVLFCQLGAWHGDCPTGTGWTLPGIIQSCWRRSGCYWCLYRWTDSG